MVRVSKRLNDSIIRAAIKEGKRTLIDGDGLRLLIKANGNASWVLRVVKDGREWNIGLGGYPRVGIKKARDLAAEKINQIDDDLDPIAEKKRKKEIPTFEAAALEQFKELSKTFRNEKHSAIWISSLKSYAFPEFGKVRVDQVTHKMIFDAISKIWLTKNETARRVRQRVLSTIDWAVAKGYRKDTIPVAPINKGLPDFKPETKHLAALPYDEIKGVLANIKREVTITRLAIELAILTCSRTREIRLAAWSQIDLEGKIWVRPPEIMKKGKTHIVPLSEAAIEVLNKVKELRTNHASDIVFQGVGKLTIKQEGTGKETIIKGVLSENTMLKILKPLANGFDVTTHGFRSSFRDWAREQTHFKDDVAEKCLAHSVGDEVSRSYLRTEIMQERSQLLNLWADYCGGGDGKIIKLMERK